MVATTKKLGPAGRYGARYGALARKQVATVERVQRAKHACTRCGAHAVSRVHTGIWACRKCDHQFAGGAYVPMTGAGRGARKALRGINERLVRGAAADEEEAVSFHQILEETGEETDYEAAAEEIDDEDVAPPTETEERED